VGSARDRTSEPTPPASYVYEETKHTTYIAKRIPPKRDDKR
jgi:hypothetical protein